MKTWFKYLCAFLIIFVSFSVPAYAGSIDETDYEYYETLEEAASSLREQMVARNENCFLYYFSEEKIESKDLSNTIYDMALEVTENGNEGDYLAYHINDFGWRTVRMPFDEGYLYFIQYSITYYTTFSEEEEVMDKAEKIISTISGDEYNTALQIYDYITENVSYDTEHKGTSYYMRHTAYAALFDETATCQGYAVTFYLLAKLCGLNCRIVRNENHSWNIVEIEGRWYFCDCCWDAGKESYKYFLKGTENFQKHDDIYDLYNIEISDEDCVTMEKALVNFSTGAFGGEYDVYVIVPGKNPVEGEDYTVEISYTTSEFVLTITGISNFVGTITQTYEMTLLQKVMILT